jgi:hypothetical protein
VTGGAGGGGRWIPNPNHLHHIFDRPEHNLAPPVRTYGSQANAYNAIEQALLQTIGDVASQLEGLNNPMVFLVFIKNGYVDFLEGAAVEDSTVGLDFAQAKFKLLEVEA